MVVGYGLQVVGGELNVWIHNPKLTTYNSQPATHNSQDT